MSHLTSERSNIIKRVETFIKRVHDSEYIISPEARNIFYGLTKAGKEEAKRRFPDAKESYLEEHTLADSLANAMTDYEENRNNDLTKWSYARLGLRWINRAFACQVIQEGEGLISKYKECLERSSEMENNLQKLSADYLKLQGMYEELKRRIPSTEDYRA